MKSFGWPGRALWIVLTMASAAACDRDTTRSTQPVIEVTPRSVFFGPVAVGERAHKTLRIASQGLAPLSVTAAQLEPLGSQGASGAFTIEGVPLQIASQREDVVTVHFAPEVVGSHEALLVLISDDPEKPRVEIPLVGSGAAPSLSITPTCETSAECVGSATLSPPSLHFGPEPFTRAQALPLHRLPGVRLRNVGEVPVVVRELRLEGPDAADFALAAELLNGTGPDGLPSLTIPVGEAVLLPLRYTPRTPTQAAATAALVVRSSDAQTPEVRVALGGSVAMNAPPEVCANLIRIEGRVQGSHADEASWAPLLTAPPGGVTDLSSHRDVRPSSRDAQGQWVTTRLTFSAHAPGTGATCTTDVEDGRDALDYRWQILSAPQDTPGLHTPRAPVTTLELGPRAGMYELQLQVTDRGGLSAQRTLRFVAVPKDDLVIELSWDRPEGLGADVDLDLHLVRPTAIAEGGGGAFAGAFDDFHPGAGGVLVSGDVNGRAAQAAASFGATAGFHWGETGTGDDPRFGGDDTGSGALIETIALDRPEHDAACADAPCRYGVFVQLFEDRRVLQPATACNVTGLQGCVDGARCGCPEADQRCVATLVSSSGPRTGAGVCRAAPVPRVSIFARGEASALAVIPLEAEVQRVGAPCELVHVADVVWPARTAPAHQAPTVEVKGSLNGTERTLPSRFFGRRGQGGGLTCQPNSGVGTQAWYAQDP